MSTTRKNEIAFVDTKLENYQSLIDGLNPGTEVILISSGNGLQKMAEALVDRSNLDAIHVFSHGSAGALQLGDTLLSSANLNTYAPLLTQIGQSLTTDGDLLLYGCNVAQGETGQAFVESIARLTQADVAASDNLTGNAALGGDWVLEVVSGSVEANPNLSALGYEGILASPVLDSTKSPELGDVVANALAPTNGSVAGATLVSALVGSTGIANFSDADSDPAGLAITGVNANGTLWYTTNGGSSWAQASGITASKALTLTANADTFVFFQPNTDYTGTLANALTIRAWDGTLSTHGNATYNTISSVSIDQRVSETTTAGVTYFGSVAYNDGKAYLGDFNGSSLKILDVTNPTAPTELYSHASMGGRVVALLGNNLLFSGRASDGTSKILDISNPGSPVVVKTFTASEIIEPKAVIVQGQYAYIAEQESSVGGGLERRGLTVLNLSDPSNISIAHQISDVTGVVGSQLSIDGNRLYMPGTGGGFRIFDLTNPAEPTLIDPATYSTLSAVLTSSVAVVNNVAYFRHNSQGTFQKWNIENLSSATALVTNNTDFTGGVVNQITIEGNYVFASVHVANAGLQLFNSTNLSRIGQINLTQQAQGFVVDSGYVYVTNFGTFDIVKLNEVLVSSVSSASDTVALTVSSNATPTLTTINNLPGATEDTQFEVNKADLQTAGNANDADGLGDFSGFSFIVKAVTSGTLKIGADVGSATDYHATTNNTIDNTNRAFWTPAADANGTLDAFTVVVKDPAGAESASPVQVKVETAAVPDAPVLDASKSPALTGIAEDIGNPVNGSTTGSTLVSTLISNTGIANFSDADGDPAGLAITGINANGTLWYSTNGGTTWTQATGISAGNALPLADTALLYFAPAANYHGSLTDAITFRAWDGTSGTSGVAGLDANSSVALSVGSNSYVALGNNRSIDGSGNYVYVTDSGNLRVIDVSNPAAPNQVGTVSTGSSEAVALSGNYAYVAAWNAGLKVVDISTPAAPSVVASYATAMSSISNVAVSGNYVYMASNHAAPNGKFYIFDVSTPASPQLSSTFALPIGNARDIFISGNKAYVVSTGTAEGLVVLDISTPTAPTTLGQLDSLPSSYAVAVSGNYAYVGTDFEGLKVVNISDPANMSVVATLATELSDAIYGLTVEGSKLYLSHGASGVQVVDISNPLVPTLDGTVANTPGTAWNTVLLNGKVFVADGGAMQVIEATVSVGDSLSSASDTISLTVTPVADTPTVTDANTSGTTQTSSGLVLSRNAADGAEVTHFKITGITNGNLFKANGTTAINNGDFITFAEGNAGLKFTPTGGGNGSFVAQASTSAANGGLGGSTVTANIVLPLAMVSLAGDTVAWAGVGSTVMLDAGANATVSDATRDTTNWNDVTLNVQRAGTAVTSDTFAIAAGAGYTVSGSNLQAGGQTFATFTNANGVLSISFANGGADATNALVQDVLRHISYRNDTPAGNATIRFTLGDGTNSSTADVTVTTDKIYVTTGTDTAADNLNDGVSFSEALRIANTQAGTETLVLPSNLASQTVGAAHVASLSGSVIVDADAASGATISGGSLDTNGQTLTFTNGTGDTLTVSTTLTGTGTGNIAKTGAGTVLLAGTNDYSGTTSITGGRLTATNGSSFGTSAVTLDGATINFGETANVTLANAITLGVSGGTLQSASSKDGIVSGGISGTGNLTIIHDTGSGTHGLVTLSGNNSYTGTTILNRPLTVSSDANLGTGNIIFNSGSSNLFITGNTVIDNSIQAGGAIAAFNVGSNTVEITGNISGSNGLSSGGSGGTLKLSGTNTYTGSTYGSLNNTIIATTDAALPDATQLELGAGTLTLLSNQVIGSLNTFTNLVPHGPSSIINLGTYHLTLGANDASKFSGAINGSGNIVKNGSGTFTVSSSVATANNGNHTGTTIINGGVLQLDGTLKGGITIASGGKLAGGGADSTAGDALGAVSVASGGMLTPGASAGVGTADLKTGALTVASGGTLAMNINGTSAGATSQGYDQVIVTGAVNVSGATLAVTGNSNNFTVGDIFVLVDNDAGDAVTGTFNGLAEGALITVGSTPLKLSYVGGTDNDITLTAQMGITSLALSADTGSSTTDFITNTASQTITATLGSALGSTGITIWGSVNNGGAWINITDKVSDTTLTWTDATLSGSSTIKIEARNSSSAVVGLAEQAYELDTTAPTTTIATMAFSADTGVSSTDFITKTASQTISGTLNAVTVAGEKVQVSLDNGSTWADADNTVGQTTWSLAGQTLTGSNTLQVRVIDAADNSGTAASQAYVLDTTAPTITFSGLALSADTGISSSDFKTATAGQTITATLSGAPAGTDKVWGTIDNGSNWIDITDKVTGTTLSWDGVTLVGSNIIRLKVTDNAGNDGVNAVQTFTLDTANPTATVTTANVGIGSNVTTAQSTETGTIYLVKSTDTPADLAALEALVTGNTATKATVTAINTNTPLTTSGLTAGTYKVYSVDAAGNVSAASVNTITLGTAPTTTVATVVFSADSGTSSTDLTTKTAAQDLSGTLTGVTVAGDVVQVSFDNGTNWVNATNTIGQNSWTLAGQTLAGSDTLQVRVTNNGFDGSAYSQAYVLDTVAPTSTVTTANVGIGSNVTTSQSTETGVVYLVKTTDDPADYAALEALVTGGTASKATVTTAGTNTPIATTGLAGGTYKVWSVDAAGNISAASANTITLGTPPTITGATVAFSADTGTSSTDLTTKTAAQDLSGTLTGVTVAGDIVQVSLDNGTNWVNATNTIGQNSWTLAGQTLAGSDTLQVRVTNNGFDGSAYSQAYVLDTVAPTSTVTTANVGIGSNVTTSQSSETGVVYLVKTTDTPADYAALEALLTGGTASKATVTTAGTNTPIATTGLTAGTYKVWSVDAAGNISAASANTITLTNTAPTLANIPGTTQDVTTGVAAALPDFTVADENGQPLTVTLTATNGSISGLVDADPGTAGIQLTGTAAQINTALADALFTATANGAASIGFSLSDGVAVPVTGTYNLNATTPPADPPVVPPAAPGATITNPDGTTTIIPTGTGGTTSITSPAPGSTVTITGSGDTTVTSPGPTVTLNNTGTGTVTTTGFTGGSTLNVTGTGNQHVDMTGLQPGDVITINNTGSGTVDLSNLPDGVVVNIVGNGPVVLNDNDGTSASVENMVPSLLANGVTGDGNGDGTPDALQSNVASTPFLNTSTAISNPAGAPQVFISLVADSKDGMIDTTNNLTATLSNVQQLDAPANLPADLQMPLGLISFDSTINIVGATTTFSLFVDSSISLNGYWKQNAAGVWCNLATTIVTEGGKTRLDFAITDGGEFDADGIANGVIVDPGAVGSMPQSIVGISAVANNTGFWF